MKIIQYSDKYKNQTISLVLGILEGEFHSIGYKRPDLFDIPNTYQKDKGNFWIAIEKNKLIGSIGLRDCGNKRGLLKRFYVDKIFRGTSLAQELLATLINFATKNNYKEIFLGTSEKMIAASKFYLKEGFKRIDSLPADIQHKRDTIFYIMHL